MKRLVALLGLINGAWMLTDGIYVMIKGKYIGPEKPGPWASLIGLTDIDVFSLGPVFVLFGLAWLNFTVAFLMDAAWARNFGIVVAFLTLWYLPFGTLISIFLLVVLVIFYRGTV
jgi:hypothetical protein